MNEILNNIMKFINDNTYLLIGICVFLILVLIGYLIDNSIKSKKVRKDVKNETMAKEAQSNSAVNNISIDKKEDIMTKPFEEKTEDLIIDDNINKVIQPVEPEKVNPTPNEIKDEITEPINFDLDAKNESLNNIEQPSLNNEVTIEEPKVDNTNITDEITEPINFDFDLNSINTKPEEKVNDLSSSLVEPIPVIEQKDPDAEIMKTKENNTYSNSKSLLEILSDVDKSKPSTNVKMDNKEETENIFNNKPSIEINTNVQKEKVEIEPKFSSDDELDKIMKKLSSMNNEEEDNYTNIF